jgi:hypothetical protein
VKPLVSRRFQVALAGAAALPGLCWLLWPEAAAPEAPAAASQPARALSEQIGANVTPAVERAADAIPVMPAEQSQGGAQEPKHPHPHTPIHDRIYRENTLFGQLNGAMDSRDAAGMRRLLAQYRDEYPEDAHFLQEGYAIIVACLERPDDRAARSAAERYWKERRASQLRRYVRRHCLEVAR